MFHGTLIHAPIRRTCHSLDTPNRRNRLVRQRLFFSQHRYTGIEEAFPNR